MAETHVVEQGECMSSIGALYRIGWRKIWDDPQNAELKNARKNPNVLYPGDELFIPDYTIRVESCATEKCHKFVLRGVPETLRIRLLDEFDRPRTGVKYELVIEGKKGGKRKGVTDGNGELKEDISPLTTNAKLFIGDERREIVLRIGSLDPITETSGIQSRLSNLGYNPGPVDEDLGPRTREAMRNFQEQYGLDVTGEPDDATCNKLRDMHGH